MRHPLVNAGIVVGGLIASAIGIVPVATAASEQPSTPSCLISNGGRGGVFTKDVICVDLVADRSTYTGSGRYSPADAGIHWLTVTIQYHKSSRDPTPWISLTSRTTYGVGYLTAATDAVRTPPSATMRACSSTSGGSPARLLCVPAA